MAQIAEGQCYRCGSIDHKCYNETTLDWWTPEGALAGVQVVALMKCNICGAGWAEVFPSDEVMSQGGNYTEDDDVRRAYC